MTGEQVSTAGWAIHDEARAKPFHLGFSGSLTNPDPTLYVNSVSRWAQFLGHATVAVGMPLWLGLAEAHRSRLRKTDNPRYRGPSSLFWHTVGAGAFWGVATERLRGGEKPLVESYTDLLTPGPLTRQYLGDTARIIVVDDFYDDPEAVREQARRHPMRPFDRGWLNTVRGETSLRSEVMEEARVKLGKAVGEPLSAETFAAECDGQAKGWNGALHAKLAENWLTTTACDIHNHANLGERSWSGLVFLDHREDIANGTSFWVRRATGRCADTTWMYDARPKNFRLLTTVPPKFNRLVLFSAPLLHRGEAGYGHDAESARLFQTFFFTPEGPAR
ncbi:hypothetical protein ACWD4G_27820 [Streptomyces sp. NPDC002643]